MKNLMRLLLVTFTLFLFCGNEAEAQKRKVVGKSINVPGVVKIKKEISDKNFYRAVGTSSSTAERSAKAKAELQAKRALSEEIKQTITSVTEDYTKEVDLEDEMAFQSSMENLTKVVSNNVLSGISIAGYELYYVKKEDKYNAYVMMQLNKEEFLNAFEKAAEEAAKKDQKLQLEFDKSKFRENYEKEMEKFKEEEE